MKKLAAITGDELLYMSAVTEARLMDFIISPKLDMRELASLSRQILRDIGRPNNMAQDLIMMQVLRRLREQELK